MTVITYQKRGKQRCVSTTTRTVGPKTIHDVEGEPKRIVETYNAVVEQMTHDGYATKESEIKIVRKEP